MYIQTVDDHTNNSCSKKRSPPYHIFVFQMTHCFALHLDIFCHIYSGDILI